MQILIMDGQIIKRFDYSFLRDMRVPVKFMTFTNAIYSLRSVEEEKKRYKSLKKFLGENKRLM